MPNLDDREPGDRLTDKLSGASISSLDARDARQTLFLYFSYYTLYGPIICPPALKAKYKAKLGTFANGKNEHFEPKRAGMVESLDQSVGRILEKPDELGIADHTLVIMTGDKDQSTGGLKGFKGGSHEEGVREPLIVRWPGRTAPGSTCDELFIRTDFTRRSWRWLGCPQGRTRTKMASVSCSC